MEIETLETADTTADTVADARSAPPDIPLGITRGLSNDDYHTEGSAVSSSELKRMLISPAHFACGTECEETRESLLFGTVLHGRLLEPDAFAARFFAAAKADRRTKVGKALAEAQEVEAAGRVMFPEEWLPTMDHIVANARRHDRIGWLLSEGEAEVALAWIDPETGIKCKVKLDWWHGVEHIVDLKSAVDVTRDGFGRTSARLDYPLSAAMYCEGVFQVTGEEPEWHFAVAEKGMPHTVACYDPSPQFMRRGREKFRIALRRLAECRDRGEYPMLQGKGYAQVLDVPAYY